jgi:hypothetical protein
MVGTKMELNPGLAVSAIILDTLLSRTSLYRLTEFFEEKDTELLLGVAVDPELFSDYNVGRSMDHIYKTDIRFIRPISGRSS